MHVPARRFRAAASYAIAARLRNPDRPMRRR